MSIPVPPLDDLVEFPTVFRFHAVMANEVDLGPRCRAAAEVALARTVVDLEVIESSAGRWVSVRLRAEVVNANEIRAVYAALSEVGTVKLLL